MVEVLGVGERGQWERKKGGREGGRKKRVLHVGVRGRKQGLAGGIKWDGIQYRLRTSKAARSCGCPRLLLLLLRLQSRRRLILLLALIVGVSTDRNIVTSCRPRSSDRVSRSSTRQRQLPPPIAITTPFPFRPPRLPYSLHPTSLIFRVSRRRFGASLALHAS